MTAASVLSPIDPFDEEGDATLTPTPTPTLAGLERLLGVTVEPVAVRIVGGDDPSSLAIVMLREQIGGRVHYRGGAGRHRHRTEAVDLALRSALLRGARPLAAVATRWAEHAGVLAVAHAWDGEVHHVLRSAEATGQQDLLLEMLDIPGVLELETEVAIHRVLRGRSGAIAIALTPGHQIVDRVDAWWRALVAEVRG